MKYSSLKALLLKRFHLPKERSVRKAIRSFSLAEKTVFYVFALLFIFSAVALLWRVNSAFLVEVPTRGGTLSEGIIGNPRFINPVLALSEADKSLSGLVYSGLVRVNAEGELENHLAEEVSISSDGRTYTARLREDARFHDGEPVTAADIAFTVEKITDPAVKSPLFGDWAGTSVEVIDERTVSFTLRDPYAPFINNLTLGILPRHLWETITTDEFAFSQFNTLPIGSGPYKIHDVERNEGGIPDYYDLTPFEDTVGSPAYIKHLIFRFYPNERALLSAYEGGEVDAISGISPERALSLRRDDSRIHSAPLPRIFGVFFNQSANQVLRDKVVRQALDLSAPKEEIVEAVLGGFGTPIDGPLPPGFVSEGHTHDESHSELVDQAKAMLASNGWTINPDSGVLEKKSRTATLKLSFSISTGNAPELRAVAERLRDAWQGLGARVEVVVFETGELNQNVIRPRRFEALLFGEVLGRGADAYPFWHSSQRNDPGLNIALYANSRVDKLLEESRKVTDPVERDGIYRAFETEIRNDVPAVFLYSPNFIYVMPEKVRGLNLSKLSMPHDRFKNVSEWYVETDNVWQLFVQ